MTTERSNRVVDTTDVYERKLGALKSHASQVGDGEHLDELLTFLSRVLRVLRIQEDQARAERGNHKGGDQQERATTHDDLWRFAAAAAARSAPGVVAPPGG